MRPAIAGLLLALAACDSSRPSTCLDNPAGTFQFTGTLDTSGSTCPFTDGGITFIAEVALPDDATANVCVRNNDASPLPGQRTGDHITVRTQQFPGVEITGCTCTVRITETLDGTLIHGADGGYAGFTGSLTDDAEASPDAGPSAGACNTTSGAPDAGPSCGLPCSVKWQVTGN